MLPSAAALKYVLPSTRKSPLMCTFLSNIVLVCIDVLLLPTTTKSPLSVLISVSSNIVTPLTDNVFEIKSSCVYMSLYTFTVSCRFVFVNISKLFDPLITRSDCDVSAVND